MQRPCSLLKLAGRPRGRARASSRTNKSKSKAPGGRVSR